MILIIVFFILFIIFTFCNFQSLWVFFIFIFLYVDKNYKKWDEHLSYLTHSYTLGRMDHLNAS